VTPTRPAATIANIAPASPPPSADWQEACRKILGETEAGFRRKAPAIYPPYASLGWAMEEEESTDTTPAVTITPGRSWKFSASALTAEDLPASMYRDLPVTSAKWTKFEPYDAVYARHAGELTLLIAVETERSAVTVAKHPLVVEFVARMKASLDRCGTLSR
jgi:hypothetical protein